MLKTEVNLNSLDIQQARIKYILFKSKLRSMLYGSAVDASLLSHRENALGQWLYNHALQKYSGISELKDLERLHINILVKAQNLVDMYKSGKIEEARDGLRNLDSGELELNNLLDKIAQKVA